MQVHFNPEATEKEFSLTIGFKKAELNFALSVLRGINAIVKADWIAKAIRDVEEYLKPKQLPMINYFHTCVHCTRSIDERDENTMCLTKDGDTKWKCRVCAPLKKNRPR
jgi:hypothetical protein